MIGKGNVATEVDGFAVGCRVTVIISDGRRRRERDLAIGQNRNMIIERCCRSAGISADRMIDLAVLRQGNNAGSAYRNREDNRRVGGTGRSCTRSRTNNHAANLVQIDGRTIAGQTRHAIGDIQVKRQARCSSAVCAAI